VHGDRVYVLDARNGGRVVVFRLAGGRPQRLIGSGRGLGLDLPTDTTEFTHTPDERSSPLGPERCRAPARSRR
jgi:hypothetical protein